MILFFRLILKLCGILYAPHTEQKKDGHLQAPQTGTACSVLFG